MAENTWTSFVAECFWAGVKESDLQALDQRAMDTVATVTRAGDPVRYLGSMLMREDEVVLCFFEGSAASVRRAAELAEIPFERILATTNSVRTTSRRKRSTDVRSKNVAK